LHVSWDNTPRHTVSLARAEIDEGEQKLTVDFCVLEFPGGNTVLKHNVDFGKGAVFGLGKTEPTPYVAEEVGARVEEAGFGAPVPCCGFRPSISTLHLNKSSRDRNLQSAAIIRGVTELLNMPVKLYVNRPMTMVLYRKRPDGVSATMG
jgi:hypothetical protein